MEPIPIILCVDGEGMSLFENIRGRHRKDRDESGSKIMKQENNSIVRKHIVFYGYVQGVGFRYRARHAADLYGCTGWVRNEWDGSVSMEIQGEEKQIDQVILAIERGTYVRIENMDVKTIPVVEHDHGFRTR